MPSAFLAVSGMNRGRAESKKHRCAVVAVLLPFNSIRNKAIIIIIMTMIIMHSCVYTPSSDYVYNGTRRHGSNWRMVRNRRRERIAYIS